MHLFDNADGTKQPYMKNETGAYVQVSVDVDGVIRTQIHPVLDHRNAPIENPNSFQINTSIQRCLAKAIALHGLGLYIFAGEDLPEADPIDAKQAEELNALADKIKDKKLRDGVYNAVSQGKVDASNFEACKEQCNKIIKEEKENG